VSHLLEAACVASGERVRITAQGSASAMRTPSVGGGLRRSLHDILALTRPRWGEQIETEIGQLTVGAEPRLLAWRALDHEA